MNLFNSSTGNQNLASTFQIETQFANGTPLTINAARNMVINSQLDAVIIIPENFTETIIGATWWYQEYRSPQFQSLPPTIQQQFEQNLPLEWQVILNNTNITFPMNSSPQVSIFINPDTVTQTVIPIVFNSIINNIQQAYNNLTIPNVIVSTPSVVYSLTTFDWMGPGFVIVGVTVGIMMVAENFGRDKELGLIKRLDTTPVPRAILLLSRGLSQIVYSSIQILILFGALKLIGLQTAPNIDWFLAYTNGIIMALPCIGIGLIIGALVKSGGEAASLSWMAILPLQFLGNAFFNLGNQGVVQFIPTYYAVLAMQNIMIRGFGWAQVWPDLLINVIFGVVLITIGLLIFKKKSQI